MNPTFDKDEIAVYSVLSNLQADGGGDAKMRGTDMRRKRRKGGG
jgi:hypothetical protein